jgi:hypothetical protein
MAEAGQKSEVTRSGSFTASPDQVWALVSDFGGIDRIMDAVESCEVEGEGVGSRRTIPMGGGAVVESLDELDHETMTLTYSIVESPLPFKDYSATMVVAPEGGGGSTLTWTGTFLADGIAVEKAEHLAGSIYAGGIAGFRAALGE